MVERPEFEAARAVTEILDSLDEEVRSRVVRWIRDLYGVPLTAKRAGDRSPDGGESLEETAGDPAGLEALSDIIDGANPRTSGDRALCIAYWLQTRQGQTEWTSQAVNTELKNLGHPVKNITDVLESLKNRRPAPVQQTKKLGKAKQARKRYRLTQAGIRACETMIQRAGRVDEE
jgi:hypothetical protein